MGEFRVPKWDVEGVALQSPKHLKEKRGNMGFSILSEQTLVCGHTEPSALPDNLPAPPTETKYETPLLLHQQSYFNESLRMSRMS